MEAISSWIMPSGVADVAISPKRQPHFSPLFKPLASRPLLLPQLSAGQADAQRCAPSLRAVARDVSGSSGGGDEAQGSVSGFLAAEGFPSIEVRSQQYPMMSTPVTNQSHPVLVGSSSHLREQCHTTFYGTSISDSVSSSCPLQSDSHLSGSQEMPVPEKPDMVRSASGGSGSRAGLFRTPISGGVQSATSAHDLPSPALAVRNLMEQARFAHLCTVMSRMHHRRAGYPFGSLVDFASDSMGHPIFSLSPLAIHTRNLLADPRCTLVVQIPGWSGLSNARVTIFGDIVPLPADQQEWARQQYMAKHQQWASHQWGNFFYCRMQNISDIYFIGGFGTVAWIDVKEYEATQPDKIAADGGEQNLKELNAIFSKPLKEMLSLEAEVDDAALISIDSKGTDIRVRQGAQFNIQRLSFELEHSVETLDEAKTALQKIIRKCN